MSGRRWTAARGTGVLGVLGLGLLLGGSTFGGDPHRESECGRLDDFRVDWNPLDGEPMPWAPTPWSPEVPIEDCSDAPEPEGGLYIRHAGEHATGLLSEKLYEGDVAVRVELEPNGASSKAVVLAHFDNDNGWGYSGWLGPWEGGGRELVLRRWQDFGDTDLASASWVDAEPDGPVILELRLAGDDVELAAWAPGEEPPAEPQIRHEDPEPLPSGSVGFEVGHGSQACFRSVCVNPDGEGGCEDLDDFRADPTPLDGSPMAWERTPWNPGGEIGDCAELPRPGAGLAVRQVGPQAAGFLSVAAFEGDVAVRTEFASADGSAAVVLAHFEAQRGWGYSTKINRWQGGTRNIELRRWEGFAATQLDKYFGLPAAIDETIILELRVTGDIVQVKAWVAGGDPPAAPQIEYRDPAPHRSGSVGFEVAGGDGSEACFHWVCVEGEEATPCPTRLLADAREEGVKLRWPAKELDELQVLRGGEPLAILPAGSEPTYLDREAPEGAHTYAIVPASGGCEPTERTIEVIVPRGIASVGRLGSSANAEPLVSRAALREGALAYVDGDHVFAAVAETVAGAEYVQTSNADRTVADHELSVAIRRSGTLFLIVDRRVLEMPSWEAGLHLEDFEDTGSTVDLHELADGTPQSRLQVYSRDVAPGEYSLGAQDDGPDRSMYVVAFRAATPPLFHRGDANADGALDIADGVFVLNFLFLGGPAPPCEDAADADDSEELDVTDGIFLLNFLFLGGPEPPSPGPPGRPCGDDPAPPRPDGDDLSCLEYGRC